MIRFCQFSLPCCTCIVGIIIFQLDNWKSLPFGLQVSGLCPFRSFLHLVTRVVFFFLTKQQTDDITPSLKPLSDSPLPPGWDPNYLTDNIKTVMTWPLLSALFSWFSLHSGCSELLFISCTHAFSCLMSSFMLSHAWYAPSRSFLP